MKLDEADIVAGEVPGQLLRDVRLPGSRRAVEDQLRTVTQQVDALL
jgi:hypothetical protein